MKQVKAVLAPSLTACSTWQVEATATPETLSQGRPRTVRLSLKTGGRIELADATLMGDSVVGYARIASSRTRQRIAVATADVTRVEFLKTNAVASVVAIGVVVVMVVAIAGAVASSSVQPAGQDCQTATYSRAGAA